MMDDWEYRAVRSVADQNNFDFITDLPRRPKMPERLFIGLFPDAAARRSAERICRHIADEENLVGNMLTIDRFHTSLIHISDRKRVRSKDEFVADRAAKTVKLPPFEITFSRLGSFPGAPKKDRPLEHPLVLLADEGPVMELHAALGAGLRRFRYRVPESFRPHLTLSYNRQFLPVRAIEPITFVVKEFVLVHSRLWLTEYRILNRWTLH
jgi:2'-5' RNA ligase